jgi:hypothetical protein
MFGYATFWICPSLPSRHSISPRPSKDWTEKAFVYLIRKAPHGLRQRKGRLGIFPASFNPPTRAHVALIREATKRFKLDEILVLLDLQAMDKRIVGASFEDRLKMLKLLFERSSRVSRPCKSWVFVEKREPEEPLPFSHSVLFMVGFDTILRVMDRKT